MLVNDEVSPACFIGDHLLNLLFTLPRALETFLSARPTYNTPLANSVKRWNQWSRSNFRRRQLHGLAEELKVKYVPSNKSLVGARGVFL
jgi:hypothetical protein